MTDATQARGEVWRAVERLPDLVNDDPGLSFRCRAMTLDFVARERARSVLPAGSRGQGGARHRRVADPPLRRARLRGGARTWLAHWRPVPGPGEYDLFALVKDERIAIEGDMRVLMRHLQNIKDILAAPRALDEEA